MAPSITYITKSTVITADMFCEDDVRIAGTIKGEMESKKKIIVTESGKVTGTLLSPEADISGKIEGDVEVTQTLVLRSSAIVEGNITTKKLTIENGAQVKGTFQVGPAVQFSEKNTSPVKESDKPGSAKKAG